jgi:rhamnulokinase
MTRMSTGYIAIDLGAESGRVIVGVLERGRLRLEEVHRFAHQPLWLPTGLHWDITSIWREVVAGLGRAAAWATAERIRLVSVGVDAWGIDWALVDAAGELVGLPHAYRDPRSGPACERAVARLGVDRLYLTTGIQILPLNTLYTLYAHFLADPGALAAAKRLLFIPDLFHHWLSGETAVEATIASTSQMVDCRTGNWAAELVADLGMPTHLLGSILLPGSVVGAIRRPLANETGLPVGMSVVAPAAHDTASAIAAVPAGPQGDWCYISSGTWSLLGAELDSPCLSGAAQAAMFTNELGVAGRTRFLKNIPGLWLVQECRRDLAVRGENLSYHDLTRAAEAAEPFRSLVDPADKSFETPGNMLSNIASACRRTGQPAPQERGQFIRCCLESLALSHREKLAALEAILGRRFDVVHVVGGGGKNALLCQMTADATGRRVLAGPHEATAAGNAMVQAMAAGEIADLNELRRVVAESLALTACEPRRGGDWDRANERFRAIAANPPRRTPADAR